MAALSPEQLSERYGQRPVRLVVVGGWRALAVYGFIVLLAIVYAARLELSITQQGEILRQACVASNQVSDVWNRVAANSVAQEQASTDDAATKAKKIAALQAFRFPVQHCP
jgi:hypothetical protein